MIKMNTLIKTISIFTLIMSALAIINGSFCFIIYILEMLDIRYRMIHSRLVESIIILQIILSCIIVVFSGLLLSLNTLNQRNCN